MLAFTGACTADTGPASRRPDLILVLLDTVRRDHVGTYGYERDTTPVIDSLGRDGLVFERAVAQSSWTLPSLASLLTSYYPRELFSDWGGPSIPAREIYTLTQALRNDGYRTISVTTNPYDLEIFGLTEGFDHRNHLSLEQADAVVARAIEEVDLAIGGNGVHDDIPYFLFLHFMDNHFPLKVPAPFDTHFPALDGLPHDHNARISQDYGNPDRAHGEEFDIYRSHTLSLYDGSLYFTDYQLGRLFDHLRERGVFENAVIVISSDHGHAFWDHGQEEKALGLPHFSRRGVFGLGHGHTLFPEQIRVPLIISGRGVPRGRVQSQVRNLDITPTLLSIADIDDRSFTGRGVPLLEPIAAGTLTDLPAFSETETGTAAQSTLWDGRHRYLRIGERELLFAGETMDLTDVAASDPGALARLRSELDEIQRSAEPPGETRDREIPGETLERLRELGYVD